MTTEDNYNASNRSIADWIAEGVTKPHDPFISQQTRANVLATIDELNQYLLGNVTIEAATDAARELTHKLNESW